MTSTWLTRSGTSALVAGCCALWAGCSGPSIEPADLVLHNGKVVTVDDAVPDGEAVAVRAGRIVAVGTDREIEAYIGSSTEVLDLQGQLAIPGFIDSHVHFSGIGTAQLQLGLMEVANWDEVVEMVAAAVAEAEPGELITGRGWHQEKWDRVPEPNVDGLPFHHSLSAVSPENPVILRHASGHATYANGVAMEMSGIDRNTSDPQGGEIVRDGAGNPIGVFRERAGRLLGPAQANARPADPREVMRLADQEVLSKGITSVHDAGVGFSTIDLYKEMIDAGELGVRMNAMIRTGNEELRERFPEYKTQSYGDHRLRVSTIKISIDGALGPHGAWLLEPYEDLPTSSGLNTAPVPEVEEAARIAAELDLQLAIHAIGDRANNEVLDIIERTADLSPELPRRVEHAQLLLPRDIGRFALLGVTAAMQPIHATQDMKKVDRAWGARGDTAYTFASLLRAGTNLAFGSDSPVETMNPLAGIHAAVTRRSADGKPRDGWYPAERLPLESALAAYTTGCAKAVGEGATLGRIAPGAAGDFVVLS
ncbi:MAG: amidohydrolase, partial [Dehalococcoidia bacterium]